MIESSLARGRLLLWPTRVQKHLAQVELPESEKPNLWQLQLGVFRMFYRVIYRSETIGNSEEHPVRNRLVSRLLHIRLLRLIVLRTLRAVAPLDFSGLVSDQDRIVRHLLFAHHDKNQFVYDFELLLSWPGGLEKIEGLARSVIDGTTLMSELIRDVAIYERYHENLLDAVQRFRADPSTALPENERNDPDISFFAYLAWCARQPETPSATLQLYRAGRFSIDQGITAQACKKEITSDLFA